MINFSISASCSYTWNKGCFNKSSTAINILKCIKTLIYGVFCNRKVKLSEVEIIYNNNNKNTIFGRAYGNYINALTMESLRIVKSDHDKLTLKTVIISADDLYTLIKNKRFLNDIHYIVKEDVKFDRKFLIGCALLPDNLTIEGDLDLSHNPAITHLPEYMTVTGSLILYGCVNLEKLPEEMHVDGNVNSTNCYKINSMPVNIFIGGTLYLANNIRISVCRPLGVSSIVMPALESV
ncbi:MAG: hypothetical protein KAG53_02985 [Endozoicomonadaceae bacterium]|nr:hypothetical protein [Endozoicomonadaceae bacterium]